jgi:hypothetical protein
MGDIMAMNPTWINREGSSVGSHHWLACHSGGNGHCGDVSTWAVLKHVPVGSNYLDNWHRRNHANSRSFFNKSRS